MSIGERTERGFEARLQPRGAGRLFGAAFLLVWLCGWLAGESVALWFLVRGAFALVLPRAFRVRRGCRLP